MKCSLCGSSIVKNPCDFCGNINIIDPLISVNDMELYKTSKQKAKSLLTRAEKPENFIIEGDILKKYKGEFEVVSIPGNVRVIGEDCFKSSGIKKVKIPASVELIGSEPVNGREYNNGAFEYCKELESVFFEENSKLKSIEKFAFYGCVKLQTIIGLPQAVKTVEAHSFCKCILNEASVRAIINNTDKKGLSDDWDK